MNPAETYPRPHRAALGAELRRLRKLAGLGGQTIGQAINTGQSTVSRIENGQVPISLPAVRAWAEAVQATPADLARLESLAGQATTEAITLRGWRATAGLEGMQREVSDLEHSARSIAGFQPCFIPGLLQTAEYARRVLLTLNPGNGLEDALARRLQRQAVLYEMGRHFEFILAEAALHWRSGDASMLSAQMDRLASLTTLPNITIRIIPLNADMHTPPVCAFWLYDEREDGQPPMAAIETPHNRLEIAGDPADIQAYRDELTALRESALPSGDTADFARDLTARLTS
jgi:transcriptional regulator with XRE-family HTH domain